MFWFDHDRNFSFSLNVKVWFLYFMTIMMSFSKLDSDMCLTKRNIRLCCSESLSAIQFKKWNWDKYSLHVSFENI